MANGNGNSNGNNHSHPFAPWRWLNTILLSIIGFFLVAMFQIGSRVVSEFAETKSDVRLLDLKVTRIELRQTADIRQIEDAIRRIDREIDEMEKRIK